MKKLKGSYLSVNNKKVYVQIGKKLFSLKLEYEIIPTDIKRFIPQDWKIESKPIILN